MQVKVFLENKIKRQILWNGQKFIFNRYRINEYKELTDEVEKTIEVNGIFHEGGGYGGILNIELYERDGARSVSDMKPMILCLYDDGKELRIDDEVEIAGSKFRVVEKNNVKQINVAFEVSLELDKSKEDM